MVLINTVLILNLFNMRRSILLSFFVFAFSFSIIAQQTIIFTETMGTVSSTTSIEAHNTGNGFDNDEFTMSDGGAANPADIRATSSSFGYPGASGGANVFFTATAGERGFSIEGINVSMYEEMELHFAYRKETSSGNPLPDLLVDFWDGTEWVNLPFTFNEDVSAGAAWYLAPVIYLPEEAQIEDLKLRWIKSGSVATRIDDVILKGTMSEDFPTISLTPENIQNLNYTFGQGPSEIQSFVVSGDNLDEGITIQLPADFQFSLTNDPFNPEVANIVLPETEGTVNETEIFVRLAADLPEGVYSENIVISSQGALNKVLSIDGNVFSINPDLSIIYPEENEVILGNAVDVEFFILNFELGTEGKIAYQINEGDVIYHETELPISLTNLEYGENTIYLELVDMDNESIDPPVNDSKTFFNTPDTYVVNGSFEIWINELPYAWFGSKSSISAANINEYTESAQDGEKACQLIEPTSSHKRFTTQTMSVTAGAEYEISFWVRGKGSIRTGLWDGREGFSGYAPYNPYIEIDSFDWAQHTQTVEAVETTDIAEFIFSIIDTDEAKDHLQIDNVSIAEVLSDPELSIISPENNSTVIDTEVEIVFEVSNFSIGTHGFLKYSVNQGDEIIHDSNDPILLTDLEEGNYHVMMELTDMEENSLEPEVIAEVNFIIQHPSPDPNIVIISPANGSYWYTDEVEIEFQVNNFDLITEGKIAYDHNFTGYQYHTSEDPILLTDLEVGTHTVLMKLVDNEEIPLEPSTLVQVTFYVVEVLPGGMETFDNLTLTGTSYASGTFLGQDGSTWSYVECRGDYEITGKAIMIGRNRTPQSNFYSGVISGGVGILNFDYQQAFATNVNLDVYVNEVLVANVKSSNEQGVIKNSGDFMVNIPGDFVFKFINRNNGDGQVVVDNISWSGFIGEHPFLSVAYPQQGAIIYDENVDIIFNLYNFDIDTEGYIKYILNEEDPLFHNSLNPISLMGLPDGIHTVQFELVDNEYNSLDPAVSTSISFTINYSSLNHVSIYDIQFTEDPGGASPYVGQEVATSGIVTGTQGDKFWIQDGPGAWNGLYVYNISLPGPEIGDSVLVIGTIDEHFGLTELVSISELIIISQNNDLPEAVEILTGQAGQEKYESVLINVTGLCTNANAGFGMWKLNDGSGDLLVDDFIYSYDEQTQGHKYTVTGIMYFSHNEFKILPRFEQDVIDHGVIEDPFVMITYPEYNETVYHSYITAQVDVMNFELGTEGKLAWQINEGDVSYSESSSFMITDLEEGENMLYVFLVDMDEEQLDPHVSASVLFNVNLSGPEFTDIYDIQFTEDPGGASPLVGQTVWVKGVVSANFNESVHHEGYYLQQGGGEWRGLYIYDTQNSPELGDSVMLMGVVEEFFSMTRLKNVSNFTIFDIGGVIADPVILPTGLVAQEKYESVLVRVENAEALTTPSYGEWAIDDGSGEVLAKDNGAFSYSPTVGNIYNITGVVHYAYGSFTINYRIPSDIEDITNVDLIEVINISIYPNPATDILRISADQKAEFINIMDVFGKIIKTVQPNTESIEIDISDFAGGVYFVQIGINNQAVVKKLIVN